MRPFAALLVCPLAVACSGGSLVESTTLDAQLVSALTANGVKCLPHTPPPFAACADLDSGAACTFSDDGRAVVGVCHMTGTGRPVCATPDDDEQFPGARAIAACTGLDAGADCTIAEHDGMMMGDHADGGDDALHGICTSFAADGGDVLACLPTPPFHDQHQGSRGRHGGPLGVAFDACASQTAGAACTFSWKEHGLAGTCIATPSGAFVCAPACHQ